MLECCVLECCVLECCVLECCVLECCVLECCVLECCVLECCVLECCVLECCVLECCMKYYLCIYCIQRTVVTRLPWLPLVPTCYAAILQAARCLLTSALINADTHEWPPLPLPEGSGQCRWCSSSKYRLHTCHRQRECCMLTTPSSRPSQRQTGCRGCQSRACTGSL